jgi:hypothetical protein
VSPAGWPRTAALALAALLLAVGPAAAQPPKPDYRPYAEFRAADAPADVVLKKAYNEAVQRYNQALYDYHVTLERHDQLVDLYNRSADPAVRDRARADAAPLRARLETQRREAQARARAVDEAARRAAVAGVLLE